MKFLLGVQIIVLSAFLMISPGVSSANESEITRNLDLFPAELIAEVMSYLPGDDLCQFRATKKVFFEVGKIDSLWRSACIQKGLEKFSSRYGIENLNARTIEIRKKIQNTSLEDLPGVKWKELYFSMRKLECSDEQFRKIEGRALEGSSLGLVAASLWGSVKFTLVGVPAAFIAGAASQAGGATCLLLAVPMIIVPEASLSLASTGLAAIGVGTMMEVLACTIPGWGLVSGCINYHNQKREVFRRHKKKFLLKTWYDLIQKCEDLEIPVPAIVRVFDNFT